MAKKSTRSIPGRGYRELDVPVGGVNIHVGRWPGRGTAVLCLHGLTANHLSFAGLAATLQKAGFAVYAPDMRGRGESSKPEGDYSLDVHAADMVGLMDALDLERVVLVGHSLGAGVAIRMGVAAPARFQGLALLDGGGLLSFGRKLKILSVIKPSLMRLGRVFPDADAYASLFSNGSLINPADPIVRAHIEYELEAAPGGGVRCSIPRHVIESEVRSQGGSLDTGRLIGMFLLHPLQQLGRIRAGKRIPFEALRCPVLILKAGKANLKPGDDLLPQESLDMMLRRIPDARAAVFPELNHYDMVLTDNPRRDQVLIDFIRSLPK